MRLHLAAAALTLALAGCAGHDTPAPASAATAPLHAPVTAGPLQEPCAPWRRWSDADMKALAAELAPIPPDSLTMRMALDWRRYYGDARACAAAQK